MKSKILIINNALEANCFEFVDPLARLFPDAGILHYSDVTPELLKQYDGYVLSGCPLTDKDALRKELPLYGWLKNNHKPILGICAGHEILGKIYGGALKHQVESEVGYYQICVDNEDPLIKGMKKFKARELHYDSVKLPKNFKILAHSQKCGVEIMRHSTCPIYGIQFHPEKNNPKICRNFAKIVDAFNSPRLIKV